MKVRKKGHNRYIKMQEGSLPAFCGAPRYKRGGGGMFGMLAKVARAALPHVGKKLLRSIAPVILDEGKQVMTRKKSIKQGVKSTAKHSKGKILSTGKEALRQEIAR